MAKFLFISIIMVLASCHPQNATSSSTFDLDNLTWLEGTWNRTKTDEVAHERWEKNKDEWIGWGVTFQGADTAFVEKIRIVKQNNNLYYVADVSENPEPIYFKLTALTANGFICENPEHDFPKRIEYKKDGNTLRATISGDGKSIPFYFQKQL